MACMVTSYITCGCGWQRGQACVVKACKALACMVMAHIIYGCGWQRGRASTPVRVHAHGRMCPACAPVQALHARTRIGVPVGGAVGGSGGDGAAVDGAPVTAVDGMNVGTPVGEAVGVSASCNARARVSWLARLTPVGVGEGCGVGSVVGLSSGGRTWSRGIKVSRSMPTANARGPVSIRRYARTHITEPFPMPPSDSI